MSARSKVAFSFLLVAVGCATAPPTPGVAALTTPTAPTHLLVSTDAVVPCGPKGERCVVCCFDDDTPTPGWTRPCVRCVATISATQAVRTPTRPTPASAVKVVPVPAPVATPSQAPQPPAATGVTP